MEMKSQLTSSWPAQSITKMLLVREREKQGHWLWLS